MDRFTLNEVNRKLKEITTKKDVKAGLVMNHSGGILASSVKDQETSKMYGSIAVNCVKDTKDTLQPFNRELDMVRISLKGRQHEEIIVLPDEDFLSVIVRDQK